MKVLSIEDSAVTCNLIREALQSLDVELLDEHTAYAGTETLQKMNKVISLILLDWSLPDKSGIDLLQEIKSNELTRSIPVIMVTSKSDRESVLKAIRLGAIDYLVKPFTNEELTSKVEQYL